MKITIDGIVYEGTPEELKDFFPDLPNILSASETTNRKEFVRRVLKRHPISENHTNLLRSLYYAGNDGKSYSELAEAIELTENQLNGVLGALGRRVNNTEGSTDGLTIEALLNIERSGDSWHYRISEELRQVLDEEGFDWL